MVTTSSRERRADRWRPEAAGARALLDGGLDHLAALGTGGHVERPRSTPATEPRVTVVVPCYNYGRYLPSCVGGILDQAGVRPDVIIVDDASPDGSVEVARQLADDDPRVSVIAHPVNKGHIATYNDGLAAATGEYVSLLSADDLLPPGALARATALMEAHPSVGFVYGHAERFSTTPPTARLDPSSWVVWEGIDWLAGRFRRGRNCILSPEVVLRTEVQHEIGGYSPELPHSGDLEMWLRAASVADVGYVAGCDQAWYRVHEANMHTTSYRGEELAGMVIDLRERHRAFASVAASGRMPSTSATVSMERVERALAEEALTLALRPYYWGIAQEWPVDDLMAFAEEIYPSARRLPAWRLLQANHHGPVALQRWNPVALGHEASLRARAAVRGWRLGRCGQ